MTKTIGAMFVGFTLASAAQDVGRWPALLSVSTNVEGMVLSLEFAEVSVIAGERLKGRMVVSNGTQWPRHLDWGGWMTRLPMDTSIGQFVVQDDEHTPVPKILFRHTGEGIGDRGKEAEIDPGKAREFVGDLVKNYALTNPGIYRVRAVATVGRMGKEVMRPPIPRPVIRPVEGAEEMIIETPIVLVTITARPASMPPPQPLYTPSELANMINDTPQVMMATHPKPERPEPVPRVAPRETWTPPVPAKAREGVTATTTGAADQSATRPRNYGVALFVVGLGLFIVGAILWRARRRTQHP
jgi:hypothetical protein